MLQYIKIIDLIEKEVKTYTFDELVRIYCSKRNVTPNVIYNKLKELKKEKRYNYLVMILRALFGKFTLWDFQHKGRTEPGFPDYKLDLEDNKEIFIEVKKPGDGIRASQIEWIYSNPHKKTLILCLFKHKELEVINKERIFKLKKKQEWEENRLKERQNKERKWNDINPFKK